MVACLLKIIFGLSLLFYDSGSFVKRFRLCGLRLSNTASAPRLSQNVADVLA